MKKSVIRALSLLCITAMLPIMPIGAESENLYGDATCDGNVDIRDVSAVARHIVKLKPLSAQGVKNCDLYSTGNADIKSLTLIKQYLIGDIKILSPLMPSASASEDAFYTLSQYQNFGNDTPFVTTVCESREQIKNIPIDEERLPNYDPEFNSTEVLDRIYNAHDEKFFEDYVLYVHSIYEGTSSGIYNINSIDADTDEININIALVTNGTETCDMAMRTICVGIPRSVYNNQKIKVIKSRDYVMMGEVLGDIYFEGCYTDNDFMRFSDNNMSNQYVCGGKIISDSSELAEIAKNPELSEKYNDEFFKGNSLIVIPYIEAYTEAEYAETVLSYRLRKLNSSFIPTESDDIVFFAKINHSKGSVFTKPERKYLVYSAGYKTEGKIAKAVV